MYTEPHEWLRVVFADDDLTPSARLLAAALFTHADKSGVVLPWFTPALDKLASECGWSGRKTAARAVSELEEAGFLVVVRGRGHKVLNSYSLTRPAAEVATEPAAEVGGELPVAEDTPPDPAAVAQPTQVVAAPAVEKPVAVVDPAARVEAPSVPCLPSSVVLGPMPAPVAVYGDAERAVAARVAMAVTSRLSVEEAGVLTDAIAGLRARGKLVAEIVRLCDLGYEDDLVRFLLTPLHDWSPSPYAGADRPGQVFYSRVFEFGSGRTRPATTSVSGALSLVTAGLTSI